jgi:uncharacterized membrane protein YidH (DUF202 family)
MLRNLLKELLELLLNVIFDISYAQFKQTSIGKSVDQEAVYISLIAFIFLIIGAFCFICVELKNYIKTININNIADLKAYIKTNNILLWLLYIFVIFGVVGLLLLLEN